MNTQSFTDGHMSGHFRVPEQLLLLDVFSRWVIVGYDLWKEKRAMRFRSRHFAFFLTVALSACPTCRLSARLVKEPLSSPAALVRTLGTCTGDGNADLMRASTGICPFVLTMPYQLHSQQLCDDFIRLETSGHC
jgi:hypothetical protein